MGNAASTTDVSTDENDEQVAWMLVTLKKNPNPVTKAFNFEGQGFEANDMVYFPSPPDGMKTDGVVVSIIDKENAVVRYHGNAWGGSKYHVVVNVNHLDSKHKKWKPRRNQES